jgi:hypothetical protein
MNRFSLVAVAGAVALLAPLGVTASAQAQLFDRSHEHITGTSEVQICGLDLVRVGASPTRVLDGTYGVTVTQAEVVASGDRADC